MDGEGGSGLTMIRRRLDELDEARLCVGRLYGSEAEEYDELCEIEACLLGVSGLAAATGFTPWRELVANGGNRDDGPVQRLGSF